MRNAKCPQKTAPRIRRDRQATSTADEQAVAFFFVQVVTERTFSILFEQHAVGVGRQLHAPLVVAAFESRRSLNASGTLIGGIAHDFNNSLATILGFAGFARGRPSEDSNLSGYLETIVQAAEQSRDLVRKLLDFSRSLPSGEVAALDAVPRIVDGVRLLRAVIPATMRIVTRLDQRMVPVKIDGTDLQQLLMNLVLNVRDAFVEHGEITIALLPAGQCTACAPLVTANLMANMWNLQPPTAAAA